MPGTPMSGVSAGATTSESANVAPIVMPIAAIARERTESRVRSAASASTAAEMAPAPWTTRPTMVQPIVGAHAAMKLPSAKMRSPATMTGLRPQRSDAQPKGTCKQRLREPVGPECDAHQRVVEAARERLRIQREHRQDDEHAEHPQAEDAGEAERWRVPRPASCSRPAAEATAGGARSCGMGERRGGVERSEEREGGDARWNGWPTRSERDGRRSRRGNACGMAV